MKHFLLIILLLVGLTSIGYAYGTIIMYSVMDVKIPKVEYLTAAAVFGLFCCAISASKLQKKYYN